MTYPLVFIQKNDAEHLIYALAQARNSNPEAEIYLIGNSKNNLYPFINHIEFDGLINEAKEFEKYYKHMSPCTYEFDLICFQRWFVLKEFMNKYNYDKVLHFDPDVMLYQKISDENSFEDFDWALSGDKTQTLMACGHVCFINNIKVLNSFCDFLMNQYKNKETLEELKSTYDYFLSENIKSGISDMVLLKKFILNSNFSIEHVSRVINDAIYDNNFNDPGNFKANGNIKHVEFKNKKPYGYLKENNQEIFLKAIHFQGNTKIYMKKFYNGSKVKLIFFKFIKQIKKWIFIR